MQDVLTHCSLCPGSRLPCQGGRELHRSQVPLPCAQEGLRRKLHQGAHTRLSSALLDVTCFSQAGSMNHLTSVTHCSAISIMPNTLYYA